MEPLHRFNVILENGASLFFDVQEADVVSICSFIELVMKTPQEVDFKDGSLHLPFLRVTSSEKIVAYTRQKLQSFDTASHNKMIEKIINNMDEGNEWKSEG